MVLRQDPKNTGQPQKLGHFNADTWGAYHLNGELYIERYRADPAKRYTDMGCSFETFTNQDMLELETLGPLVNTRTLKSVRFQMRHWIKCCSRSSGIASKL